MEEEIKYVVVTGASGFLGTYVVRHLSACGYRVITMARNKVDIGADNYSVNLTDQEALEQIGEAWKKMNRIYAVIHLAADIAVPGNEIGKENNCRMTENILNWALKRKCERFVQISSVPVIGEIIECPIKENHPVMPRTLYHQSKYMCEQMADKVGKEMDMAVFNLRIPSPIGVGMSKSNLLSLILNKAMHNETIEVYGEGGRVQNYIDVRDIAEAIKTTLLVDETKKGLYLLGGESISNYELVKLCVDICRSESAIIIGRKSDREEENKWILDTSLARKQLGFVPQHTLRDTIEWILRTGNE